MVVAGAVELVGAVVVGTVMGGVVVAGGTFVVVEVGGDARIGRDPPHAGRTTAALATTAARIARGRRCPVVTACNRFDGGATCGLLHRRWFPPLGAPGRRRRPARLARARFPRRSPRPGWRWHRRYGRPRAPV